MVLKIVFYGLDGTTHSSNLDFNDIDDACDYARHYMLSSHGFIVDFTIDPIDGEEI